MKVGDLVKMETQHNQATLRPPWYGKTGVIVSDLTWRDDERPLWKVLIDGKVRKISSLYLKVVNETR